VTASTYKKPGTQVVKVEASARKYAPGEAVNKEVDILLEDHPLKTPFRAKLVGFIEDLDRNRRGWYLASLKSPTPIIGDPVTQALIFARGAWDFPVPDRPAYDGEGRQISYHYDNPMEEMLLNPNSSVKYVIGQVATIKDPSLLKDMRLTYSQINIYPFATICRPSD
jgi:hypothetical protein